VQKPGLFSQKKRPRRSSGTGTAYPPTDSFGGLDQLAGTLTLAKARASENGSIVKPWKEHVLMCQDEDPLTRHALAPIDDKTQPAAVSRSRKTAEALNTYPAIRVARFTPGRQR
jgi:hypothetical protein